MPISFLKSWFKNASKERREALCELANTSINVLWQWASETKPASAKKAAEVEMAARKLGEPLRRGDICVTCAECPYYNEITDKEDLFGDEPLARAPLVLPPWVNEKMKSGARWTAREALEWSMAIVECIDMSLVLGDRTPTDVYWKQRALAKDALLRSAKKGESG